MPQVRKVCIFCGGHPLSGEHMWADWLKAYLPREEKFFKSFSATTYPTHTDVAIKKHPGDHKNRKVKRVCIPCNTRWMSVLQNDIKPILVPLLHGQKATLHRNAQTALATWATLFTMVAEHFNEDDETRIAIPKEQLHAFKKNPRPPKGWKIWIAHYEGKTWRGWNHDTAPVLGEEDKPQRGPSGTYLPNSQSTTFLVGKLYVHVFSSKLTRWVRRHEFDPKIRPFLFQIWPVIKTPLPWPPTAPISDMTAEFVSGAFFRGAQKQLLRQ